MHPYTVKNYMWAAIIFIFVLIMLLSGCSTVDGMGKDISSASKWTKDQINGKDSK